MNGRPVKIPGPDHPISIEKSAKRVVVTVAGQTVADSRDVLMMSEGGHDPVAYVPRKDVQMAMLSPTDHETYCPYKGAAAYFSIPAGGEGAVNAVWTYEAPYDAVAAIKDHVAFYPGRVDSIDEMS